MVHLVPYTPPCLSFSAIHSSIFHYHIDSPTGERTVHGVEMVDGSTLTADIILTGCSPYHTFVELMGNKDQEDLGSDSYNINSSNSSNNSKSKSSQYEQSSRSSQFKHHVEHTDFSCGAFKINLAVNKLPNFSCYPSPEDGSVGPMHRGTLRVSTIKLSIVQYSLIQCNKVDWN